MVTNIINGYKIIIYNIYVTIVFKNNIKTKMHTKLAKISLDIFNDYESNENASFVVGTY